MAEKDDDGIGCEDVAGPAGEHCTDDGGGASLGDGPPTSPFEAIAENFSEAAADLVKNLATFWFNVSDPTLSTERGPVKTMFENIEWITAWVAVLALLLAAGRMAWERRAEPAREALGGILRLVLSTSAVVAGANLVLKAGDEFSHWIVNQSTKCEKGPKSQECVDAFGEHLLGMTTGSPVSSGLLLVLALLLIMASLMQVVLLLARGAMLIVLLGTLPMAAALSSTQTGRAWFQKSIAWLLAFLLYKPAAALVYAAGFAAVGTKDDSDLITQVSGVMLLILAALTLPALMRIATPLVDSAATSGSGGAGGLSAVRTVASGSLMTRGRSGGGKSSPTPSGGARPAPGPPGGGSPDAGRGTGGRPSSPRPAMSGTSAPSPAGPSAPEGAPPSAPTAPRHVPPSSAGSPPPRGAPPSAPASPAAARPPATGAAPAAPGGSHRTVSDPRTPHPHQGGPRGSR